MGNSPVKRMTIGIIGGGAAGMSCALWLSQLGHNAAIIERSSGLGGQLLAINRTNRWLLGFPELTSVELARRYAEHIDSSAVTVYVNSYPIDIASLSDGYQILFQCDGQQLCLTAQNLVLATGTRALGVELFAHLPGGEPAKQSGLLSAYPLDHLDYLPHLNGRRIAVIGGGDNAHFTAKDIALAGADVHLVMRSQAKAQRQIRAEISDLSRAGRITLHCDTMLAGFRLQPDSVELALAKPQQPEQWLAVDQVFFRIGFAANSEFLDPFDAFSGLQKQNGYLITDTDKRTTLPGVYALGDVTNPKHQSVVAALADGAVAAQAIDKGTESWPITIG